MNKHWLIIGLGAGVISLVFIATGFFDSTSPQVDKNSNQPPSENVTPSADSLAAPPSGTTSPGTTSPEAKTTEVKSTETNSPATAIKPNNTTSPISIEQAKQNIVSAELSLSNAEIDLDVLETEMDDVERYVESLEQKGEDPAKFAEEGMLLLGPIIEKYESTLVIVEAAEKQLAEAQSALAKLSPTNN